MDNELLSDDLMNLKFTRKKQKSNNDKFSNIINDENFFLNPSFEIVLNNPTIKDVNIKHLTIKCVTNDIEKLKTISEKIIEKFKSTITFDNSVKIYDIGDEYIRCCLPSVWSPYTYKKGNYICSFFLNNEKININSNTIKSLQKYNVNKIIIEVKNIWKSNDVYAFNNIIKEVYLTDVFN